MMRLWWVMAAVGASLASTVVRTARADVLVVPTDQPTIEDAVDHCEVAALSNEDSDPTEVSGGGLMRTPRSVLVTAAPAAGRCPLAAIFPRLMLLPVGNAPMQVVVSDFNADHIPDVATPNALDDSVSIWVGLGTGEFARQADLDVGDRPWDAVDDDFDGDGFPDLAVISRDSAEVWILRGGPDGLAVSGSFATGSIPVQVVSADLNSDSIPDLIAALDTYNGLSILIGRGDGTFEPHDQLSAWGLYGPIGLAATDIDGDGRTDLVIPGSHGRLDIRHGNGDGTLQPPFVIFLSALNAMTAIVTADFDSDDAPDIGVFGRDPINGERLLRVLKNDGQGGLLEHFNLPLDAATNSAVAEDVDGDGAVDLVTASIGHNGTAQVLHGLGDGRFEATARSFYLGTNPSGLDATDANGDGLLDIVSAVRDGVNMVVGVSGGTFLERQYQYLPTGSYSVISVADIDRDGRGDIVAASGNGGSAGAAIILRQSADRIHHVVQSLDTEGTPKASALFDLNGDEFPDLIVGTSSSMHVWMARGDGTFGEPALYVTGGTVRGVAAQDLDGDGYPEVIAASWGTNDLVIFRGMADGRLDEFLRLQAGNQPGPIAVADLDGDGELDLVTANGLSDDLSLFFGTGELMFADQVRLPTGEWPRAVVARDIDGDGAIDLVVATQDDDAIEAYPGAGDGTFGLPTVLPIGASAVEVLIGDLDGDGVDDMVTGRWPDRDVAILRGLGEGSFEPPLLIDMAGAYIPRLADLDGDGDLDLIAAGGGDWGVCLRFSHCPLPCPADLDGDAVISFTDLLVVLSAWGPCDAAAPCPADLAGTGDGIVSFDDLLIVLSAWGPCP